MTDSSSEEDDGIRGEEDGMLISSAMPDLRQFSEAECNQGGSSSSISRSPPLSSTAAVRFCQGAIDDGGHPPLSSVLTSSQVTDGREDTGMGNSMGGAAQTTVVELPCPVSVGCPVVCVGDGQEGDERVGVNGEEVFPTASVSSSGISLPDVYAPSVCGKAAVGEVLQPADPFFSGGDDPVAAVPDVLDGGFLTGAVISKSGTVPPHFPSLLPIVSDYVGHVGDGMVSEEDRVSPGAREALRSQVPDGIRQSLSSPVGPVMGAEGGVGQCRSYAHVVKVDRQADVEISYIPPSDSRNTICMEESDGDISQWGSSLVGHFLQ
ncbi:hypothetical protein Dimus_029262, partial [Dionaea muscipula]